LRDTTTSYAIVALAACLGGAAGSVATAYLVAPRATQVDHLLKVVLGAQSELIQTRAECSKRCASESAEVQTLLARAASASPAGRDRAAASEPGRRDPPDDEANAVAPGASAGVDWDRIARADNLVSAAAAPGRWSVADRDQIRELVSTMPTEQRHRVLLSLVQLLNEGKVKVDDGEVPF